jgi:transglutaminase-like putative cysteine protease
MNEDLQQYLEPTYFFDYDQKEVADFAESVCTTSMEPAERAIALYYAVRDQILYNPYDLKYTRATIRASAVLQKKSGYCVAKAVLLAAVGRQQGIPSRLGFADVTNHLTTQKLREMMETDIFTYHGYTEFFINEKWVKATPAFNLSLCTRFNVRPLEFDAVHDSIFHEFDTKGNRHMEYLRDHGHFADLPFETILTALRKAHPKLFEDDDGVQQADFAAEAELETKHIREKL